MNLLNLCLDAFIKLAMAFLLAVSITLGVCAGVGLAVKESGIVRKKVTANCANFTNLETQTKGENHE